MMRATSLRLAVRGLSLSLCLTIPLGACDSRRVDVDAALPFDGGTPAVDGGSLDGGPRPDAGSVDPVEQIAALHTAPTGALDPALPVDGAIVTYVREAAGEDPAGFFLQAGPSGPAVFVELDPSMLEPVPAPGDVVSLEAARISRVSSQTRITALGSYMRLATGQSLAPLTQDLTEAIDADDAARYESELVRITGTLGTAEAGGPGHARFRVVTSAVDSPNLVVRAPDSVVAARGLAAGCEVTVGASPVWRFATSVQVQAYVTEHVERIVCAPPEVVRAVATDFTHVSVTFSRALDASTVQASDFTFAGGTRTLVARDVAPSGVSVVVTTDPMEDGVGYTVIVSGVAALDGAAIGSSNNASFTGIGAGAAVLILSEYVEGTSNNRAVEITNVGTRSISLDACSLRLYANGSTAAMAHRLAAVNLAAGSSYVVCHQMASAELMAFCDEIDTTPVNFTGDDALDLFCEGSVADSFGQVGVDPGAAWVSGPTSTQDQTLRRRCSVSAGDPIATDAFDVALEWESLPTDTFAGLGSHCP